MREHVHKYFCVCWKQKSGMGYSYKNLIAIIEQFKMLILLSHNQLSSHYIKNVWICEILMILQTRRRFSPIRLFIWLLNKKYLLSEFHTTVYTCLKIWAEFLTFIKKKWMKQFSNIQHTRYEHSPDKSRVGNDNLDHTIANHTSVKHVDYLIIQFDVPVTIIATTKCEYPNTISIRISRLFNLLPCSLSITICPPPRSP